MNRKLETIPEHEVLTPLRKTIMLLKRHRDTFFEFSDQQYKPTSIVITTLSALYYEKNSTNSTEETLKYICSSLKDYINNLNSFIPYQLKSPVSEENFLDKWNSNKKYREDFELWVHKLNEDSNNLKYFINSCKDSEKLTSHELNIFLLSQKHTLSKFEEKLNNNITCVILRAENICYAPHFQEKEIKNRDIVPKNISIKFIAKTNIDKNEKFKVYWRVINTGKNAFRAKCLRGDMFFDPNSPQSLTRIEPTAYSGIHSIEAFIVQNSTIIAKSAPFVIKIK